MVLFRSPGVPNNKDACTQVWEWMAFAADPTSATPGVLSAQNANQAV